jgi:hypothetical protein
MQKPLMHVLNLKKGKGYSVSIGKFRWIKRNDSEENCNILNENLGIVFTKESIVGKLLTVIEAGTDYSGCMLSNVDITKGDINDLQKNLKVN